MDRPGEGAQRSHFEQQSDKNEARVEHLESPSLQWPTKISADMVAASCSALDRMQWPRWTSFSSSDT